jgi:hypothetical protein
MSKQQFVRSQVLLAHGGGRNGKTLVDRGGGGGQITVRGASLSGGECVARFVPHWK